MNFYYKGQPIDSAMTEKLGKFFGFNYYNHADIFHHEILDKSTIDQTLKHAWYNQCVLVYDGNEFTVLAQLKKPVIPENNQLPEYLYYELKQFEAEDKFKKYFKTLCIYHRRLYWSMTVAVIIVCAIGIGSFVYCVYLNQKAGILWSHFIIGTAILVLLFIFLIDCIANPYIDKTNSVWNEQFKKAVTANAIRPQYILKPEVQEVISPKEEKIIHYKLVSGNRC